MQSKYEPVICKNCGNEFSGKYCNLCGEKIYDIHDKSIPHFFEDAIHFISHFEGTLFTTIGTLFTRPGKISLEYCEGLRKKYFRPLQFFLLLVVIYLLFPAFEGLNMRLQYYQHMALIGNIAARKIDSLISVKSISFSQMEELFRHKSEKIAKILLIVLIPITALFLWALTYKRRKFFFEQLVFSTEINCIYILWGFLLLPLLLAIFEFIYHYFSGNYLNIYDGLSGLLIYIPLFIYVIFAGRRFYNFSYFKAVCVALVLLVIHPYVIVWIYKAILFSVTIFFI